MNRIAVFLMSLLAVFSAALAVTPLQESASPGVTPTLHRIAVETTDGSPEGPPRWFRIETSRGDLEGTAEWSPHGVELSVAIHGDSARLVIAPRSADGAALGMTLEFQDLGVMEYEITEASGTRFRSSTIRDCAELENREIYPALVEAQAGLAAALENRDLDMAGSETAPEAAVYYLIRTMAYLPELMTDCRITSPLYGVCVVKPGFKECVNCCEKSKKVSSAIHFGCKLVAIASQSPILGGSCLLSLDVNNCRSLICAGKPGDPSPVPCGDGGGGICRYACPHQNAIPGDCGDDDLVCCAD